MRRHPKLLAALFLAVSAATPRPGGSAFAQPDRSLQRSVESASMVVVGEPDDFKAPTPRAIFVIAEALKGEPGSDKLVVDFEKAPVGMWPKKGERMILCLAGPARGGAYELASYFGSVIPPDRAAAVKEAVKLALAPKPDESETGSATVAPDGPATQAQKELAARLAKSDTILVGSLSNLKETVDDAGRGASSGVFRLEEALFGYGGFSRPLTVRFPGPAPAAGRYALFLKETRTEPGFTVASSKWGAVKLTEPAEETALKESVAAVARLRKGTLTTVQATLHEWQEAWNKRDLERCILCYSNESLLRKSHDAGGEARETLARQMKSFPGAVAISLQSITLTRPTSATAKDAADANVLLRLTSGPPGEGIEDSRMVTMKFVLEEGEWRIFGEGF